MQVLYPYDNTADTKSQAVNDKLSDSKAASRITADKLAFIGRDKRDDTLLSAANAMYRCGDALLMRQYTDGTRQVAAAIFCKSRFCPMCQWRRARKEAGQLSEVMRVIESTHKVGWIALSYSPRAKPDIESGLASMDNVLHSFQRLWKSLPPCFLGAFRAVEMRQSDGAVREYAKGWWQPHIHAILCVSRSYFSGREYLSRKAWESLICRALDTETVQFHVERIDGTARREGTAAETAKYVVKPQTSIVDMTDNDLYRLFYGVRRRRMHAYLGLMRSTYHTLFASDDALSDNADLTNGVDDLPLHAGLEYWYEWMHYVNGTYIKASPVEVHALEMSVGLSLAARDPEHDQMIYPTGYKCD